MFSRDRGENSHRHRLSDMVLTPAQADKPVVVAVAIDQLI